MGYEKIVTLTEMCAKTCCKTGIPRKAIPKLPYVSPEINFFSITDNEFRLVSSAGENLSSLFYFKDKCCINILDMASFQKGFGYGTRLLKMFINIFNDKKINLAACWEKGISSVPPHKFYIQNGFVPIDKKAEQVLRKWIERGGMPKDFPIEYELCEMVKLPKL